MSSQIEQVVEIAREAGEILKEQYTSRSYSISTKSGPTDYVTTADLASEAHIKKRLAELFPNDKIFSEEDTNRPTNFSGRVWFVDPLDGTASFVAHEENFTVIIGLCENGTPVLGVVCEPLSGVVFYAEKNKGAWRIEANSKKKIQVSTIQNLNDARVLVGTRTTPAFIKSVVISMSFKEFLKKGDGMCGRVSCIIAQGEAECRVNVKVSKWDTCGPQIILEEAGGKMTDSGGNPPDYAQKEAMWQRLIVSTNGSIHAEVLEQLQDKMNKKREIIN
ncbi:MAG: inositol monophosphatase family protein [Candidatus Woesearchaeota archaeon]|nr:inositol monophosphatase family protein [Candidatus Woesearchaeota archaeon]